MSKKRLTKAVSSSPKRHPLARTSALGAVTLIKPPALLGVSDFIQSNPDARELKRAVAVQMFLKGYKHREIGESLEVSSGFISKWTRCYKQFGVSGLKLGYAGSVGYLEPEQRQCVLAWLKSKNDWNLAELQAYVEQEYEVVFNSKQSYYTLFEQAGISWKKTQKHNPRADPALVEKKTGDYHLVGGSSA